MPNIYKDRGSSRTPRRWLVKIDHEIIAGPMLEREADRAVERLVAFLTTPADSLYGRLHRAGDPTDPLDSLTAAAALRDDLDGLALRAALRARDAGITWQAIADAAGITKQRAHQRWA